MINAVILDVDGVLIGEKIGFNSPYPYRNVIARLKNIRKKSIPVSLCTAKPHFSIQKIIEDAELNNLHITNGGGVIINPINNVILKKYIIPTQLAQKIVQTYLENDVYTEFYTVDDYIMQKNQQSPLTAIHTHILQREPKMVSSLIAATTTEDIVKIMPIAKNIEDKNKLVELFEPFKNDVTLGWGLHPIALPHQFGIITAKGISKKQAVMEIAQSEGVNASDILAVGDSTSDWQFIELCGYAGAMGNANEDLKALVRTKPQAHYFIGKSVDENGIVDIFDYFFL